MKGDKNDPLDFWKKYYLLNSSKNYSSNQEKATSCRFCGKGAGEVSFNEDTHLLPELLGANKVLTFDECDQCNHLFSKFESHLATFIRPYITMLGIAGKKGIPIFQSRSENGNRLSVTTLEHIAKGRTQLVIGKEDDVFFDAENKFMEILFRQPPIIPENIYKAVLKIGLSLLPRESDQANADAFLLLAGINSNVEYITYGFKTTLQRAYFATPFADLYRATHLHSKTEDFPEHTLVLGFANQVFQIFLPFSDELRAVRNPKRTLCMNLYPAMGFDQLEEGGATYRIMPFHFASDVPVKLNHRQGFSFQSIETFSGGEVLPALPPL